MKVKQKIQPEIKVFNDHSECTQIQQGNELINIERENIDKLIALLMKCKQ